MTARLGSLAGLLAAMLVAGCGAPFDASESGTGGAGARENMPVDNGGAAGAIGGAAGAPGASGETVTVGSSAAGASSGGSSVGGSGSVSGSAGSAGAITGHEHCMYVAASEQACILKNMGTFTGPCTAPCVPAGRPDVAVWCCLP